MKVICKRKGIFLAKQIKKINFLNWPKGMPDLFFTVTYEYVYYLDKVFIIGFFIWHLNLNLMIQFKGKDKFFFALKQSLPFERVFCLFINLLF